MLPAYFSWIECIYAERAVVIFFKHGLTRLQKKFKDCSTLLNPTEMK